MQKNDRLHALDAVRASALLLGIVLHATMSFFLPIPALDSSQSVTLGVTFYVIHIFRMSAFYLIAGFFARLVIERRGVREFVRDRSKRILLPMIGGWVVFAPPLIAIVIWGVTRSFPDGLPEDVPTGPQGVPLTHLWFLYYLCLFYVIALAVRWLFDVVIDTQGSLRRGLDRVMALVLRSYFAPILFAVPICAVLYLDETWPVWFGLPTPDVGFTPKIPAMVGFGTAFAIGWFVHRQMELLSEWQRRWHVHLVIAIGLTVASLSIVGIAPDFENLALATQVPGPEGMRLVYAACYTAAIWYWTFAMIGAAMRYCSEANATRRYLADSSYWLYLAHLPIVMLLQVLFMSVPLHWSIKFSLILAISMVALLLTYRYWVRHTWIGATLNGRRHPRPLSTGSAKSAQEIT